MDIGHDGQVDIDNITILPLSRSIFVTLNIKAINVKAFLFQIAILLLSSFIASAFNEQ